MNFFKRVFVLFSLISVSQLSAHAMDMRDPEAAKAYYNLGTTSYENEGYEAAIKYFSEAIQLESEAPDAYFNRGLSFRRLHKIDEAILDFTKAIQLYPDHPGYYFERCNALIVKNDFEGAVSDCSEAIRLSPAEAEPYFLRGLALMLQGDLDGAFADSTMALDIKPDYRDAQRLLFETLNQRIRSTIPPTINQNDALIRNKVSRLDNPPKGVFSSEKT